MNGGTFAGVTIRGYKLWWTIGLYGPFLSLRAPGPTPCPATYSSTGEAAAEVELRSWRDAGGVAHGRTGEGPEWAREALSGIARQTLSAEEAELVRQAADRLESERFPARPAAGRSQVPTSAIAEITAVCEAERTPLRAPHVRPNRTCTDRKSVV